MRPDSTLTSSAATAHLRRSLQALPHLPQDEVFKPRRGRVEHFVPAVWIPDGKTESCMRCGRAFGWRRRRHHCRLCGRCVCASCSDKVCVVPLIKPHMCKYTSCLFCFIHPLLHSWHILTSTSYHTDILYSGLDRQECDEIGSGMRSMLRHCLSPHRHLSLFR
jgi:hypothetical protein